MTCAHALIAREFEINKISFLPIKSLDTGVKFGGVLYNNERFVLQTPEMKCPFGESAPPVQNKKNSVKLDMSFYKLDERESLQEFKTMLTLLEEKAINFGAENTTAWFHKKYDKGFIKEFFTPLLKYALTKDANGESHGEINHNYPPRFSLNLPRDESSHYAFPIVDNEGNPLDMTNVNFKNALVTCIIQCTGLWVADKKFGLSWKILKMRVIPEKRTDDYAFRMIGGEAQHEGILEDEQIMNPLNDMFLERTLPDKDAFLSEEEDVEL